MELHASALGGELQMTRAGDIPTSPMRNGGSITMTLQDTFWGAHWGELRVRKKALRSRSEF